MKKLIIILAFLFVSYGSTNEYVKQNCERVKEFLQISINNIAIRMDKNELGVATKYAEEDYKFAIIYQAICKD